MAASSVNSFLGWGEITHWFTLMDFKLRFHTLGSLLIGLFSNVKNGPTLDRNLNETSGLDDDCSRLE